MYERQLLKLIRASLLYINPQLTNKVREKGKRRKRLTIYLLSQNLFSGLIFLLIYGFAMFAMNFVELPGFFTYYVALFDVLGLTQSISVIYNIFFKGSDLRVSLPLPFGQERVFSARILVVALTIVPFVFPFLVTSILTGWRADLGILLTIIISIFLLSLFLIILFCLASLIVFGLVRTAVSRKYRKTVSSTLLGSLMLITFVEIMWMNHQTGTIENGLTDRHPTSILLPFYDAASQPLSQQGLLGWRILVITTLGFFPAVKQLIVPKLTE